MLNRRNLLAVAASAAVSTPTLSLARLAQTKSAFPAGFLWGAATAGHQIEGNNVNADYWVLEHVKPTAFIEPSGDACNSFELWEQDLDLVKKIGLNSYRFSLEWARIEPAEGQFSQAMLDHYKRMIEGCRVRGLTPVVTFSHFTTPSWFAGQGGWTNAKSPDLFARYCETAARHLSGNIGFATTVNEPNLMSMLKVILPPPVFQAQREMLKAAARATGSTKYSGGTIDFDDLPIVTRNLLAAHQAGRAAIKAVRPDLPVGLSLSIFDDVASGENSVRDQMRADFYGPWFDAIKSDDFVGVQNYERVLWGPTGKLPPPPGAITGAAGGEIKADSLANAVRYAHASTGRPIMVTEHGFAVDDDRKRADLLPQAIKVLGAVVEDNVPLLGYIHWSLLDNFEWVFGYKIHFGLASVDRTTFERRLKPSAAVFGAIARAGLV